MKTLDLLVIALLIIGGLNWGLVGLFGFNLVSFLFGDMTLITRIIYSLVGFAAAYDLLMIKSIFKRWNVHLHKASAA